MAVGTGRERELLRLLPRLLDAATESIVAIDPTGSVTYANAAAERMYGWDAGERPTSCPVAAAIAEDPAGVARRLMERVRDGDAWTGRLELQRRDGVRFHRQVTATPVIADERVTDILLVVSEVSGRERAEERLAQSFLREAQRVAHVGHWRWDTGSDRVEWLSDEMYAIHGVTPEWIGTFDAYMALVPEDDHPAVHATVEEVLRVGRGDLVHRIVRPDGVVRHVRHRTEAVYAADGTPVVVFGTCQDVTDQTILSATLKERVKELTCLVAVSQVLHDLDNASEIYACVGAALVLAMQHPDRAVAIIDIDGRQHSTASATAREPRVAPHLLTAPVSIGGHERGRIQVGYHDQDDDYLPEERDLLDLVSSMVALWLERREAAAALAHSESRFRRLLHNVPDVVFRLRVGGDGGFDYVSPAVETLTGYRPDEFLADPQLVRHLLGAPTVADPALETSCADEGEVTSGLVQIVARDGGQRWVEYNLVLIEDGQGDVIAVEGVARDATSREVAAQASQERAHEQAVLARISEAAVTAADLDSLFETAARLVVETLAVQACSITELTPDRQELFLRGGVGWSDGAVGTERSAVAGSFSEQTLRSDAPSCLPDLGADGAPEAPFVRAHGFVSGAAVRIAGKEGTFGVLGAFSTAVGALSKHHVTFLQTVAHILGSAVDRWKAESALALRERHFRTLAQSLPDIVGRIDRHHRHIYVNGAVEVFGVSADEVIGRTLREVGLPADVAGALERAADEVFATGQKASVDFCLPTADGARYLQSVMVPEFESGGAVATVVAVTRDMTAERRAEELRREGLARIVAAQEEERGRIGEDIHDDSIQVMTAVGMRLEGLKRQIDHPEALLMLGRLEDVVRHSIGRLRALMFELRPPELDREGLTTALRLYLQATAEEESPQCEVVDEWTRDLPLGARTALYRIALEAVTNARKHAKASWVKVMLDAAEGGVRMRVCDDGSGFDVAALCDVGPHHMGMRTMRERADAAEGRFHIESSPDGTVVSVWLPHVAELAVDAA